MPLLTLPGSAILHRFVGGRGGQDLGDRTSHRHGRLTNGDWPRRMPRREGLVPFGQMCPAKNTPGVHSWCCTRIPRAHPPIPQSVFLHPNGFTTDCCFEPEIFSRPGQTSPSDTRAFFSSALCNFSVVIENTRAKEGPRAGAGRGRVSSFCASVIFEFSVRIFAGARTDKDQ